LLRCLVSCARCGLACRVWNNGRYARYGCRALNSLVIRCRPEPCHGRQITTKLLDAAVWADLRRVLTEPAALDGAMRPAQQGWLTSDERAARRQGLHGRRRELERQIERLVDAYQAGLLDLEELRQRRAKLEERRAALEREAQQLAAETIQDDQLRAIAGHVEAFRARIGERLERATFAEKREIVELLVDRVIIDSPEVEIRYVIPLTGAAERNRVLRSRHRAPQSRGPPP